MRMFRIFVLIIPLAIVVLLMVNAPDAEYMKIDSSAFSLSGEITVIADAEDFSASCKEDMSDIPEYFGGNDLFDENILLAINLAEPSDDIYHEIKKIRKKDDGLYIYVKRIMPDKVTSIPGNDTYLIKVRRTLVTSSDNYYIVFT